MSAKQPSTNRILAIVLAILVVIAIACGCVWQVLRLLPRRDAASTPQAAPEAAFVVAYSPEKEELFLELYNHDEHEGGDTR